MVRHVPVAATGPHVAYAHVTRPVASCDVPRDGQDTVARPRSGWRLIGS